MCGYILFQVLRQEGCDPYMQLQSPLRMVQVGMLWSPT